MTDDEKKKMESDEHYVAGWFERNKQADVGPRPGWQDRALERFRRDEHKRQLARLRREFKISIGVFAITMSTVTLIATGSVLAFVVALTIVLTAAHHPH